MSIVPRLLSQAHQWATAQLGNKHEARWLLQHIARSNKVPEAPTQVLSPQQRHKLLRSIALRKKKHTPLQYLLGSQPFLDCEFLVRSPVLIPRPETEEWVLRLLQTHIIPAASARNNTTAHNSLSVLDLGCGSGCVGISIAKTLRLQQEKQVANSDISVTMVDRNPKALQLSFLNIKKTFPHHKEAANKIAASKSFHLHLLQSDWFSALENSRTGSSSQKFDFIVSNPPYLTFRDYSMADLDVRLWEDRFALIGNRSDGTDINRFLLYMAPSYLNLDGCISVEFDGSKRQADVLQKWAEALRYRDIQVWHDLAGKPRVLFARCPLAASK